MRRDDFLEAELTRAQAAELDDLLSRWHQWQQGERVARGYAPKALVVGNFRSSRQYDDANGQLDADLEHRTMRVLDHQVREMAEPWRAALYADARACMLGIAVFTSPRLPADRQERERIVQQARRQLAARLSVVGVMGQ